MAAGYDTADGAMRRMSFVAALGLGAVCFGAAVLGSRLSPALVVLVALSVALVVWIALMAQFVLGAMDERARARAMARASALRTGAEGAEPAPAATAQAKAAQPLVADPLPVTRSAEPATRVPPRKRARKPAPKVAQPEPGVAGGLDAAVARSHDGAKAPASGPERLARPRGGIADDLKSIRGIGPKLEQLLNEEGIWHFDQIASWKARDIAAVDARLGTFRGRITRDAWVKQARILANGGEGRP